MGLLLLMWVHRSDLCAELNWSPLALLTKVPTSFYVEYFLSYFQQSLLKSFSYDPPSLNITRWENLTAKHGWEMTEGDMIICLSAIHSCLYFRSYTPLSHTQHSSICVSHFFKSQNPIPSHVAPVIGFSSERCDCNGVNQGWLFQVGRLEVEEAVFRKLKMDCASFMDIPEGCKVNYFFCFIHNSSKICLIGCQLMNHFNINHGKLKCNDEGTLKAILNQGYQFYMEIFFQA